MKKIFTLCAALLTMGAVMAQTIVADTVEKRNVLIEEFTGVGCGYCPDGHAKANEVCATYAGHAWAINIHQGGYATGSGYETEWGDGLAGQYNISGYPCGVTNRCPNMQNRGQWAATAATVRSEDSPVNLGAEAFINPMTRQLTVNVEAYYTGSQSVSSNYLNVVLLQNNVIGPQSNYGSYNADYIMPDGSYRHMHMLRDMITGQWGEEITDIAAGSLVRRTYTYDIPTVIGSVAIENFADLQVLVFMTETHKNVLTANEADITILPGAYIAGFTYENEDCSLDYLPVATLSNTFEEDVTTWVVNYDGAEYTYNKTVAAGTTDTIHLPLCTIPVTSAAAQNCATTKNLNIVSIIKDGNVVDINGATSSITFAKFYMYTVAGPFTTRLGIDAYRTEAGIALLNQSNCQSLWSETNFGSDIEYSAQYVSDLPNASYYDVTFNPAQGLYILRITDSYGDGWIYTNNSVPSGIWITDANGNQFVEESWGYSNGIKFSEINYYLNVTSDGDGSHNVGIDDVIASVDFNVYPNPATDRLNISCGSAISEISILDISGRTVMTLGAANSVNVSGLAAGVYMVRVVSENGIGVQKFVKE